MHIPQVNPNAPTRVSVSTTLPMPATMAAEAESQAAYRQAMTREEMSAFDYRLQLEHQAGPVEQAGQAITTITQQLDRAARALQRSHPELATTAWDVSMKDGKLVIEGDLPEAQRDWLSARLNGNAALVGAVKTFYQTAEAYLETSNDNPMYQGINATTGALIWYAFHDVAPTLEKSLHLRSMIDNVNAWKQERDHRATQGPFSGYYALEYLAAQVLPQPR